MVVANNEKETESRLLLHLYLGKVGGTTTVGRTLVSTNSRIQSDAGS